ncbi:unnamed protein product [Schistosoma margrebowiei]|uniref:carbonic anhydrase n=1 Tax=Schistosoma margrebowiei TaxID=48269 RepID=A0A183M4N1_9TREM|nr:unnamed protein product [Schistosoma margrebowiei]
MVAGDQQYVDTSVISSGSCGRCAPLAWNKGLPTPLDDLSRYYTYSGSLTTPPCNECVTWIVLDEPVVMTIDQLETLRQMHANCVTCGQTDNFRPICPIGSRLVRCSFRV